MFFRRTVSGWEARVLAVQKSGSPEERDALLRDLEPEVRRIASKVCKRVISPQDDEYAVAYRGMNEAIDRFSKDHGVSFRSFAEKVLRGRLVDYFRQEQKHHRLVPWHSPHSENEDMTRPEIVEMSFETHRKQEETAMCRHEIQVFVERLAQYGISLEELVKKKPKHRDTRENLLNAARFLVSDRTLLSRFYTQKKPDKEVAEALGMHRRTLSRHRSYLIALTIVVIEDLTMIRGYIGL
ncbi:sigma-70 family RNA polymerase sigma factor [Staphylospora marina]|uniref:sigma-70 family RNA polymerase sigma factor n=1 Tax=Staphylospora marina TaxID=2490858 RepID=UPI0013DDF9F5|nr:sigma-70 family RNA polymerase sigma factor [Staphylospora marina]